MHAPSYCTLNVADIYEIYYTELLSCKFYRAEVAGILILKRRFT
jgi:hypothetical protein